MFWLGGVCLAAGCLLGLHLNAGLTLHRGVPGSVFLVYGGCVLIAGILYVTPPVSFWRRPFGEVVLAEALGLLPVLGAYLVQVGDITRRVYLAAAPLVVVTMLWIWIDELTTCGEDETSGRKTLVVLIGPRRSGRFVVPVLSAVFVASILGAVVTRSVSPWALAALLASGIVWGILAASWKGGVGSPVLLAARRNAFRLHLVTSGILAVSSLPAAM